MSMSNLLSTLLFPWDFWGRFTHRVTGMDSAVAARVLPAPAQQGFAFHHKQQFVVKCAGVSTPVDM